MLEPVTEGEIEHHKSLGEPINYIGMHGVEKDSSNTTPLRLVANSALKNCNTGPSVNDLWPKGPNSLSNLFKVFAKWRNYPVALVWDLTKAYHSIHTSVKEKFLRLVVWRMCKTDEEWLIWGFVRVAFGDLPASVLLEMVKSIAAEAGIEIDEEAAQKISEDSYVDDNLSGGTPEQVDRVRGNCIKSVVSGDDEKNPKVKFTYEGTASRILDLVALTLKVIVRSVEKEPDVLESWVVESWGTAGMPRTIY